MPKLLSSVTFLILVAAILLMPAMSSAATAQLDLPVAFVPSQNNSVAFSRDGKIAFVASFQTDTLFAFDTETGAILSSIQTGDGPTYLTLHESAGRRIIGVTNTAFIGLPIPSVSFFDAGNPQKLIKLSTALLPRKYAIDSTDRTLTIDRNATNAFIAAKTATGKVTLFTIEIAGGRVAGQLNLGRGLIPLNAAYIDAPGNERLLIAENGVSSDLLVIDVAAATAKLLARIKLPGGLSRDNNLAVTSDGSAAYLASIDTNLLFAIDLTRGRIAMQINAGQFPLGIDLIELNGKARIAVTAAVDSSVNIFEATGPANLSKTASYKSLARFLTSAPTLTADGRGFVATTFGRQIDTFDAVSGAALASSTLAGSPDALFASQANTESATRKLAIISVAEQRVTIFDTGISGEAQQEALFAPTGVNFNFAQNILFSRDNRRAFVASPASNELLIIDTAAAALLERITVGNRPMQVAMVETENFTRLATINQNSANISLIQLDKDGARVTGNLALAADSLALGFIDVVFSRDGQTGYVSDGVNKILAFDAASGALLDSLELDAQPIGLSLYDNGTTRRLAALTFSPDNPSAVVIIDATRGLQQTARFQAATTTRFALNNQPVFSTDGRFVFITASFSLEFLSIDAASGKLIDRLRGIIAPQLTLFNREGQDRLVAVDVGAGQIYLIDIDADGRSRLGARVKPPKDRFFTVGNNALVNMANNRVYLADYGGARLLVIDPDSGLLLETIMLSDGPGSLALSNDGRHAIVLKTNGQANGLTIIDL